MVFISRALEGAFFNSGQSCCAVEVAFCMLCPKDEDAHQKQRIYVHESIYDDFVPKFLNIVKTYKLGDPTEPNTNLGPVVSLASADRIRKQVEDAGTLGLTLRPQSSSWAAHEVTAGAKKLIAEEDFPIAKP